MASDLVSSCPLSGWLLSGYKDHAKQLPGAGKIHYESLLPSVHNYLNANIHPTVQARGALYDKGVYLTDHGPDHIDLVLKRASALVQTSKSRRTDYETKPQYKPLIDPYEACLLILAIHFHDVGNIYGRDGHEQRIMKVMETIGPLEPLDVFHKRVIAKIATAHGGNFNGDRDTIRHVEANEQFDGEIRYRPQLLAAVLRLADELSDDHTRADLYGLRTGELPPTCLLYHKYAGALRVSFDSTARRINLKFEVHADDLRGPFKKATSEDTTTDVFFLDEIYDRTLKTYNEMVYCMRYMHGLDVHFTSVDVEIEIFEDKRQSTPLRTLSYLIGDEYPGIESSGRATLERLARNFRRLPDGEKMAAELEVAATGHNHANS